MSMPKRTVLARVKERIEIDANGCWLYTWATVQGKGYGTLSVHGKRRDVHRALWEELHGELQPHEHVLHKCDVRRCCNPDHLYVGTHDQNMVDMKVRGRAVRGEQSHLSRLTYEQAAAIRQSDESSAVLAERHGVARESINNIRGGRTWAR